VFSTKLERERLAGLRADVDSWQARLASDIATLDPGDDAVARQALSDASERDTAAGALLARASTVAELDVAKRIVLEGLYGTRLVRQRRGLPLGPELPADPRTVNASTQVDINGELHTAHPAYHPDRPHFFGGGLVGGLRSSPAPGGYYRTPFWQKALAVGGAVAGVDLVGDMLGGNGGGSGWDGDRDGGGDEYDRGDAGFGGGGGDGGW